MAEKDFFLFKLNQLFIQHLLVYLRFKVWDGHSTALKNNRTLAAYKLPVKLKPCRSKYC